jgi:hypothetical protein
MSFIFSNEEYEVMQFVYGFCSENVPAFVEE